MDNPSEDSRPATMEPDGSPSFLAGGGEMGALLRSHGWAQSVLGAPACWPPALKATVRIMLTSRQPICVGWGKELTFFYNDAYKATDNAIVHGGRLDQGIDLLSKPYTREALAQKIRQVLRNQQWCAAGVMAPQRTGPRLS